MPVGCGGLDCIVMIRYGLESSVPENYIRGYIIVIFCIGGRENLVISVVYHVIVF